MTTNDLLWAATLVTALGCGLIAGFFYAFSIVVMKALARLPPQQGIAAMRSINVVVIRPLFLVPFLGTGLASAVLAVLEWWIGSGSGRLLLLAASLVYVVGVIVVTMAFNVPRNNALAAVNAESEDGARLWADYLVTWTAWNHVRTVAPLIAAALLTIALAV